MQDPIEKLEDKITSDWEDICENIRFAQQLNFLESERMEESEYKEYFSIYNRIVGLKELIKFYNEISLEENNFKDSEEVLEEFIESIKEGSYAYLLSTETMINNYEEQIDLLWKTIEEYKEVIKIYKDFFEED